MSSNIEKDAAKVDIIHPGAGPGIYTQALCWGIGAGCAALAAVSRLVTSTEPGEMSVADLWLGVIPIDVAAAGTAAAVLLVLVPRRVWGRASGFATAGLSRLTLLLRAVGTVLWVYPAAALLTVLTTVLLRLAGAPVPAPLLTEMALRQDGILFWVSLCLATVVIAPVAEEFLFRTVVTESLRELGLTRPAVVSAACFAVVHQIPAHVPGLFLLGLVLSRARRQCGGLALPILIHALFNAAAVMFLFLARILGFDNG